MGQTGTKAQFASWLLQHKKMTYTNYTSLSATQKTEIRKEYSGK